MKPQGSVLTLAILAVALYCGAPVWAGDDGIQLNFGGGFFSANAPCALKKFPAFELITPVPPLVDPIAQPLIPLFCSISVSKEGSPVKKARGTFTSELYVLDNNSGEFQVHSLGSGKFKTGANGFADFDFDLPAEIFADGFESGDVSAWSYTRVKPTRKKKADAASTSCQIGASKSSGQ